MAFQFTAGERHVFARQPYVPLSEWAARNLIVRDGPHAGGRYRRDVNPYLVGIMDAWSAPGVEEVVVCGSAQTGKTLVMHAALCYCVARRPGPRMLAMQDDDAMGKVAQLKLLPMFRSSPGVRGMLGKVRAQRIGFRDGTSLFLASAQSPGQRASISIPGVFDPVSREGRILVDGGLTDPVPVSAARALGAEVVIAVDLNGDAATPPARPPNLLATLLQTERLVENALSRLTLAQRPADVLIRPKTGPIQTLDFLGGRAALVAGEEAVRDARPALEEALER